MFIYEYVKIKGSLRYYPFAHNWLILHTIYFYYSKNFLKNTLHLPTNSSAFYFEIQDIVSYAPLILSN